MEAEGPGFPKTGLNGEKAQLLPDATAHFPYAKTMAAESLARPRLTSEPASSPPSVFRISAIWAELLVS